VKDVPSWYDARDYWDMARLEKQGMLSNWH
jgi:hypothetical protein